MARLCLPIVLLALALLVVARPAAATRPRALFLLPHPSDPGCRAACRRAGLAPITNPDSPDSGSLCAHTVDGNLAAGAMRPPPADGAPPFCQVAWYNRGSPRASAFIGAWCGCLPPKDGSCGDDADADLVWTEPGTGCPSGYILDPRRICTAKQGRNAYFGSETESGGSGACGVYFQPKNGDAYGAAMRPYRMLCVPGRFIVLAE